MIRLSRVYDHDPPEGGRRFLVDRLWPRGVRRDDLELDGWLPDVAPSNELRRWYHHEPGQWDEFRRRYFAELDARPEAWQPLLDAAAAGDGDIILLYGSRYREQNNAVALAEYLGDRLAPG